MNMKKPRTRLRTYIYRLLSLCMAFALCALPAVSAEQPAASKTVRVGFASVEGLMEIGEDGSRSGLVVDYLQEISKYTNWTYEFVDVSPERITSDFLEGKYDLMGGVLYSQGFEDYFAYPEYSIGSSRAVLLCRNDDESLKSYNLQSLNGKTIGVYDRATEKIRRLEEFLRINGLTCTLKYYSWEQQSEDGDLYTYLENGEVDMLLGNELEANAPFRAVASFDAQPYYIVAQVGDQELLDGLNTALASILESDPDYAAERYAVHFPDACGLDIQLNEREKAFIAEHETIRVATAEPFHPFYCYTNPRDGHNGIVFDLLEKISAYSGLRFAYVYADSYAEAIQLVQDGQADMLGFFLDSEDVAVEMGLALTRPYVSMNNIVVKNKSVDYPDDGLTAAVVDGRALPAGITAYEIKSYATALEGLKAVDRGEADFVYAMAASLEDAMQTHRFVNAAAVTLVNNSTDVSFALARPVEPELLSILNKAISSMSEEEKGTILDRNFVSMGYSSMDFSDLIYANPIAAVVIIALFLALLVTGILLVVRVRFKNTIMRANLEKAQAESRAKGEFLSRMSHEIRTPMNAIVGLTDLSCMSGGLSPEIEQNLSKIRSSSQYLLSLINDILDMSKIESGMLNVDAENFSLGRLLADLESMMRPQAELRGLQFVCETEFASDLLVGDPVRLRQVLLNLLSNAFKFTKAGGTVRLSVRQTGTEGDSAAFSFQVEDTGVGVAPENQDKIFGAFEQVGTNMSKSAGTGLGLPISRNIVRLMGGELGLRSRPGEGSTFFFDLTFPLGKETEQPAAEELPDLAGVRVLLAEDNDLNAEIAMELLRMQGVHADRAADGEEAVQMYTDSAPGRYQAVLMDIQMPRLNGLEATKKIRASAHPEAAAVPIIAMTANTFREDVEAAGAAGMNGFIAKPVDAQRLYEVLRQALQKEIR